MKEKINEALNDQVAKEGYSSMIYLAMSTWCDHKGLEGCAQFFRRQSDEEHMHMTKLIDYILEMDGRAIISGMDKPQADYDSINDVFQETYRHEQLVTRSINDLVDLSVKENDHSTHNFLQWYVEEQREEEGLIRSILDKIALIGDGPMSLYYIDKEVERINAQTLKNEA